MIPLRNPYQCPLAQASELFMAFDANGDGGIDEREFMKALFPLDYRRIYRRASGMTFGA